MISLPTMPPWRYPALLALVLAGCSSNSSPSSPPPAPKPSAVVPEDAPPAAVPVPIDAAVALEVLLESQPLQVAMAERKTFKVKVRVANRTADTIDPKLATSELLVNGEPSLGWKNTIANTGHSAKWSALPAGDTTGGTWSIGERLFDKPGDYTLQLRVSDILSAPVHIHVGE